MIATTSAEDSRADHAILLAISAGFALLICFFPPSIFQTVDYIAFYRPNFHFFSEAVKEGRLPLWNPYIGLGRPFLADLQSAVFYPPAYLLFIGQTSGVFLLVWGHLWLAAKGMGLLARALQFGKKETYFVIVCFLGSGLLMTRWFSGQLLYACGLCYIPLLFANATHLGQGWNLRRIGFQALLFAFQILSGHPQVFWFSSLGLGAFVIARNFRAPWKESLLDTGRAAVQLGLAGLWAFCIAAIALLPFFELIQQGNRSQASAEFSSYGRMDWKYFQSLVQTDIGGLPVPWEFNVFIGIFVAILGIAGLLQVRDKNMRGLLGVALFSMLIAIGDNSPLFNVFLKWLPGYGSLRVHARAAMLIGVALICGAGFWLSRPHAKLSAWFSANFDIPVRHLFPVLFSLQVVFLLHSAWVAKRTYRANDGTHSPDSALQRMVAAELEKAGLTPAHKPPPRVSIPSDQSTSNNAMLRHYGNFDAYTSLFLMRPWIYLHAMRGVQPPRLKNTALAQEVYQSNAFPYTNINLVAALDPESGKLLLATNPSPRAFVVYDARIVTDFATAIQSLVQGHDIYTSALIEEPARVSLPKMDRPQAAKVQFQDFGPNAMVMEVNSPADALIIVAEAWYPGWKAEVDSVPAPVMPANGWMRAVSVPAGRHVVRMSFHQNYLATGAGFSLAAITLLVIVLLPKRKRVSNDSVKLDLTAR
jgi:hypothetical protein